MVPGLQVAGFECLHKIGDRAGPIEVGRGVDEALAGNRERHAVVAADQRIDFQAQAGVDRLFADVLVEVADEQRVHEPFLLAADIDGLLAGHDFKNLRDLQPWHGIKCGT